VVAITVGTGLGYPLSSRDVLEQLRAPGVISAVSFGIVWLSAYADNHIYLDFFLSLTALTILQDAST
jgi:hypothetical protein